MINLFFKVPIACTESKQTFLAMKWIISSCRDKERRIPVSEKLATEILAAYKNEVRYFLSILSFLLCSCKSTSM